MLRIVYHLPLRQATEFAQSIFALMGLSLEIPHYSTLSRRSAGLDVFYGVEARTSPAHIVIDSTGVKVYGQGEWQVRQHGASGESGRNCTSPSMRQRMRSSQPSQRGTMWETAACSKICWIRLKGR